MVNEYNLEEPMHALKEFACIATTFDYIAQLCREGASLEEIGDCAYRAAVGARFQAIGDHWEAVHLTDVAQGLPTCIGEAANAEN